MKKEELPAIDPSIIYGEIFDLLELTDEHRINLNSRGLSKEDIEGRGYKSWPIKRQKIAGDLARKHQSLKGVPGFYQTETGVWDLAGASGIAIPVRNIDGKITGVKIRVNKPANPQAKYISISSNPKPHKKTGEVKYLNGTSASVSIHYPLGRPGQVDTLRITEGELKADITSGLTGVYTISIPGVNLWKMALESVKLLKPKKILLALDSDKNKRESTYKELEDKPFAVAKALANLYLALKEMKEDVSIEDWPESSGKGIDDVLMNGNGDSVRLLEEGEAKEFCDKAMVGEIPEGWLYIIGTKRFVHQQTLIELDKEQFNDRYIHEYPKGIPAFIALRNPAFPKVDLPIYVPNRETRFEQNSRTYFNLWRPNNLEPEEGDIQNFLDHAAYIIPNEEERNILLDFLAYNVQFPGKKILWTVLLQGVQGTGKSYFGSIMRLLLGSHNVSNPSNENIHEAYTGWQKSCQLIVIEELMARGRLELMNKLKPMITQDIAVIREMFKPAYEQPNMFNLLMFTNHEDAIIIDETDRRYCVLWSDAKPRPSDYYEMLWDWTEKNAGKILHFFLHRDLSKFKPKAHAPMTRGKKELISASQPPLMAWMKECIEASAWPFMGDLVSTTHLEQCLPSHLKNCSLQALGKTLKNLGADNLGQIRLSSGSSVRMWCVRNAESILREDRETWVTLYEQWSVNKEPGGNPLLDAKPL